MADRPSCENCKHVNRDGMTCKAFQSGIPLSILAGEVAHIEPLPDDNGIQYEPIDTNKPQDSDQSA